MAGTKTNTEGNVSLVCATEDIAGSSVLNSIEGIDVSSIQDRATCYERSGGLLFRFFEDSMAAPAAGSVIKPTGILLANPGRWLLDSGGGGGGGVPLPTIQNITSAGPTAITDSMNTLARVNFAGASNVQLPAGTVGQLIRVKDVSGDASNNPITVGTGGTLDGAASQLIQTDYGALTMMCVATGPAVWDVL